MRSDVAVVLFLQSDALWQLTLDCWKSAPNERPDMSAIVHRLQLLKDE
jgi:hypothetical protein